MSEFYDCVLLEAQELISEFGKSVIWQSTSASTPVDPSNPWIEISNTIVNHSVDIVILPIDLKTQKSIQYITGTLIPTGNNVGYMGNVDFTPTVKDIVVDGSEKLTIKNIDVYKPNGTPLLYIVEFKS